MIIFHYDKQAAVFTIWGIVLIFPCFPPIIDIHLLDTNNFFKGKKEFWHSD